MTLHTRATSMVESAAIQRGTNRATADCHPWRTCEEQRGGSGDAAHGAHTESDDENGAMRRMGPALLARPHSHVRPAEEELESVVVAAGHGTAAHRRFARATQQPTAH